MADKPKKRRVIVEIDDWTDEPFEDADLKTMKDGFDDIFADYDLEVTSVKVEDVDGR